MAFNDKGDAGASAEKVYKELKKTIKGRQGLDPVAADGGRSWKNWAVEKGGNPITPIFFSRLRGMTAEKT